MASLQTIKLEFMEQAGNEDDSDSSFPATSTPSSSFVPSISCGRSESVEPGNTQDISGESDILKLELTRVVGDLALCKVINSEKEAINKELREKIEVQNGQLREAEDLIVNLQARVDELEEGNGSKSRVESEVEEVVGVDLREMNAMFTGERALSIALKGKYDKLKSSLEQFGKEFDSFVVQVKNITSPWMEDDDVEYEDIPLYENNLETVLENTNKRFQKWAECQNQFEVQLIEMTELVIALAGVVKSQPPFSKRLPPNETLNPNGSFEALSREDDEEWEEVDDVSETVPIITSTFAITSTSERVKCQHGQDPENPLGCLCGRTFLHRYNISKHLKYFTSARKFSCNVCPKRYMSASQLREHYRRSHKIKSALKEGVGCGKCGQIIPNDAFHKHKKNCTGRTCSSSMEQPDIDAVEIQEVEDVRGVNYSGSRHRMNIGLRQQGYFCICGKNFISRKTLDGHIISLQAQTFIKPEYVELGDETLGQFEISGAQDISQHDGLSMSSRTHEVHPERHNACLCGYQTNSRANLSKHLSYFSSEKIFKCDLCPAKYVNTTYLRQHCSREHKEVPEEQLKKIKSGYKICAQRFPSKKATLKDYKSEHASSSTNANNGLQKFIRSDNFSSAQDPNDFQGDDSVDFQYETFDESHDESPVPIPIPITIYDDFVYTSTETVAFQDTFTPKPESVDDVGEDPLQLTTMPTSPVDPISEELHEEDVSDPSSGKFLCTCGVNFSLRKNLVSHVWEMKRQGKFKCNVCQMRFIYPSALKRHVLRSHKICVPNTRDPVPGPTSRVISAGFSSRPLGGGRQGRILRRRLTMQQDVTAKMDKTGSGKTGRLHRLLCKPCGKYFKQRVQLIQHKKRFHKEKFFDEQKASVNRRQVINDQLSDQAPAAPKHSDATVEGGDPTCSCGREYQSKQGLGKHIRLENRGKLFQCKSCSKFYEEYANLRIHARKAHAVKVPGQARVCSVCHRICCSVQELKRHMEQFH